jgi:hypothetical protein
VLRPRAGRRAGRQPSLTSQAPARANATVEFDPSKQPHAHPPSLPRWPSRAEGSADSGGYCNRRGPISSIGLATARRLRGRSLSSVATQSRSIALWTDRSVPLGKYWRSSPLVSHRCRAVSWTPRPSASATTKIGAGALPRWCRTDRSQQDNLMPGEGPGTHGRVSARRRRLCLSTIRRLTASRSARCSRR